MSRPKPTVLLEHVNNKTGKCEQVIEGSNLYVVVYKAKPINLKSFNKLHDGTCPTYKKTAFTNAAHAYNLAARLNAQFQCDHFDVMVI